MIAAISGKGRSYAGAVEKRICRREKFGVE
jgi:hypothetical protein